MLCHSIIRVEVQSPHVAFVDVGEVFQWLVGSGQLLSGFFCLLGFSFFCPSHIESRFWLGILFVCFFASFGISRLLALSAFEIYETKRKPKGHTPRSLVPRSLPGLHPSFLRSEPSYVCFMGHAQCVKLNSAEGIGKMSSPFSWKRESLMSYLLDNFI